MQPNPLLGRIVLFTCDKNTAEEIGATGSARCGPGEQIPAMIVSVGNNQRVNLQLFLDAPNGLHVEDIPFSSAYQQGSWNYIAGQQPGTVAA